jgi:signal transduction histidine kinase
VSLDRTSDRAADAGRVDGGTKTGARTAVRLAWLITALAISSGVSFLALLALNSRDPDVVTYEFWGAQAVTAMVFPAVGALIVSRIPRNALGWLFCLMGLSSGFSGLALEYAVYALVVNPNSVPGGVTAAWLDTWLATPGFVSFALIPLLFPDGRPPSRRWRPVVWVAAGAIVVVTVSFALMPGPLENYPSVANPFGIEGAKGIFEILLPAGALVIVVTLFAGIASLIFRYRRSRGTERQQLKWFSYAAAAVPFALLGNSLFPDLSWLIGGVGVACIPIAIGIAILKHRLYDIDLVINRTLVYAALTACVVGIYVLVVGYLGALLSVEDSLFVSLAATGLVAVLFAPLRDRLQQGVNRLMYGERDDPYAVISRLGERLKATDAPEAVLPTIVQTVAGALKLPHAAISLRRDDGTFGTVAASGHPKGEPLVLPLSYGTETIGQLKLSPRAPGETFGPADRRLLDDLARHAEAAAYAVRLTADLQRSRERLVNAREDERRRLRRDLHDGLGPQLATLILKLDAARNLLRTQPQAADALLAGLKAQTQAAISGIRRLVYDLRPPALDEMGLIPAIREQATNYGQSGLDVSVEAPKVLPPPPAAVEVAAYRIVQEALTNVSRHAKARACRVRLSVSDGLELEITDDGVGMPEDRRAGVGLSSMRERAAELGGTCAVEPMPGGGTRVLARLPLPGAEASDNRRQANADLKADA